jgi:hypothetical protein
MIDDVDHRVDNHRTFVIVIEISAVVYHLDRIDYIMVSLGVLNKRMNLPQITVITVTVISR